MKAKDKRRRREKKDENAILYTIFIEKLDRVKQKKNMHLEKREKKRLIPN